MDIQTLFYVSVHSMLSGCWWVRWSENQRTIEATCFLAVKFYAQRGYKNKQLSGPTKTLYDTMKSFFLV